MAPMSQETKEKIRARLQAFYATHPSPRKGVPMSEATKAKIRESHLARKQATQLQAVPPTQI